MSAVLVLVFCLYEVSNQLSCAPLLPPVDVKPGISVVHTIVYPNFEVILKSGNRVLIYLGQSIRRYEKCSRMKDTFVVLEVHPLLVTVHD